MLFLIYYNKELIKYNEMMGNAKIKAINRAKDIGISTMMQYTI